MHGLTHKRIVWFSVRQVTTTIRIHTRSNIYRGTADMFCLDHKALAWSKAMLVGLWIDVQTYCAQCPAVCTKCVQI